MQIVIDIPDSAYHEIKEYEDAFRREPRHEIMCAILDGIPLPEGHGRLIDADALMQDIRDNSASYFADDFAHEWVDVAPTIIEADKGERK